MTTGALQQSGDVTAQIEQMIATLGQTPVADGKTGLLKQLNAALAAYTPPSGSTLAIAPANATGETIPRAVGAESVTIATVSGTIYMQAIYLPSNTIINDITTVVGTTASSNDVTINWAALCNASRTVLAVSANATAQLTPSGFNNTLAMTAAFTTTYSGLYYIAYTVGATTTQPTLCGNTAAGTELNKIVPIICGTSSTAGTAAPPVVGTTLGAITASASNIYAFTS
jgi:hypothetical protein